ncbi:hypothetical protein ZIOFF_064751 [Zingiber officinale]|uniref:Uncharacterized protein n=1 Tax=Zingiber officinale TaxID=94328 RepID=A0A8J5EWB0_ZINOF|nr:hypothetical protein ZIOFF_064751 [Zingiber officinale]
MVAEVEEQDLERMANLPPNLSLGGASFVGGPAPPSPSAASSGQPPKDRKIASAEQLVLDLCDAELRENALLDLSKKRDIFQDLAPLLWHSYGTIAILLQEIVSIYPALSPPTLSPGASNRVCNALALLQVSCSPITTPNPLFENLYVLLHTRKQEGKGRKIHGNCVASHPDTRILFLNAHIPLYLYPFLNTTSKTRPFEYLRLTSLGVIGALVKVDDTEVISFLLQTEIIPLCLRTMEMGSELSKTVRDIQFHFQRFFAVGSVLGNMVVSLADQPSTRLLKHIIRCYLRLSDNQRACGALRGCLPEMLKDGTFNNCLRDDPATRRWLTQLLHNVSNTNLGASLQQGGFDHMMGN